MERNHFAFNVTPTNDLFHDLGISSTRYNELFAIMHVCFMMHGNFSEILSECSKHVTTPQELIFMGYLVQYYKNQKEIPAPNLN